MSDHIETELPQPLVEAVHAASAEPMLAGTFALYQTSDGGLMLVTETPQQGVTRRAVPGAMVKLAMKMAEGGGGPMGAILRRAMGGG